MTPGDASAAQSARPAPRITPVMRQYLEAKAEYPDALLLFRMGDFYELFFEDAQRAALDLELTLTSRDKDKGDDAIPMAGFPHHAAASYISRLIEQGHKVAICDQMEDPRQAKGLVKRAITRVVTSGTALEDEVLDARRNNFLAALVAVPDDTAEPAPGDDRASCYGLAAIDVSTGECSALQTADLPELIETIDRLGVTELLHATDLEPGVVRKISLL
ncbi:MAG: hypothetical protein JXR83_20700, partial [Deltaproteobacteria bacterium]|nr:hypothetical protein [Deltaproteobacteria bacterium]